MHLLNPAALRKSLELHEGIKTKPYEDSEGNLTIGIGRNLDKGISKSLIDVMYQEDVAEAVAELDRAFTGWREHSEARQTVLVELMFNLGAPRLAGFKLFWLAMRAHNYPEAAKQLMDSLWAKQVKTRAVTLADRLLRDVLP